MAKESGRPNEFSEDSHFWPATEEGPVIKMKVEPQVIVPFLKVDVLAGSSEESDDDTIKVDSENFESTFQEIFDQALEKKSQKSKNSQNF